jgi:hypothetical protein
MTSSPLRRRFLVAAVVAFLAAQVLVPAVALFGPRPARFGWHMYSALPPVPEAWAVTADGTREQVDLGNLFAVQRAEIDYVAVLRAGLCAAVGAREVEIRPRAGAPVETIPCP